MESIIISTNFSALLTKDPCHKDSFYTNFSDEDVENLSQYAFDMGYLLEPVMSGDQPYPVKFKVVSKANPAVYGWISKVNELVNNEWQESFLYGFYRKDRYFNKYPISFNINSRQMRGKMKRDAEKNPKQRLYFRTIFGVLDLEPQTTPIEFVFSWLYSCRIHKKTIKI